VLLVPGTETDDLALQLALDEVLLLSGVGGARVWRPAARAVVLGISSKVGEEIRLDACRSMRAAVLRRMSGGATVLLAPGCVCFSFFLRLASVIEAKTISGSYRYAIDIIKAAFDDLGIFTGFEPPCDVTYAGRKLVGIAQARRRRSALVHGVIPVELSVTDVARCLSHPTEEPAYRARRSHEDFMTTVRAERPSANSKKVAAAVVNAAERAGLAAMDVGDASVRDAEQLVSTKYGRDEWNLRR
jgi:lipoate-protein ligase A